MKPVAFLLAVFHTVSVSDGSRGLLVYLMPEPRENGYLAVFDNVSAKATVISLSMFGMENMNKVNSIDCDMSQNNVYLSDSTEGRLYMVKNVMSKTKEDVSTNQMVQEFFHHPTQLTVDWITKNIYFSYKLFHWISIKPIRHLNETSQRVILHGLKFPEAIAVDPINRYLFWSELEGNTASIGTSSLSGRKRKTLLSGLFKVTKIALDYRDKRVYWLDVGRTTLESATYDGNDRVVIRRSESLLMYMSDLTLYQDLVCVTVQSAYIVECINKISREVVWQYLFRQRRGNTYKYKMPWLITSFDAALAKEKNQCETKGCEHICITESGTAECMCVAGFKLSEDGVSCTESTSTILHDKAFILVNNTSVCQMSVRFLTTLSSDVSCLFSWSGNISYITTNSHSDVIYFTDDDKHSIVMFVVPWNANVTMVSTSTVSGLVVNWISKEIYWSESDTGTIMSFDEKLLMEIPILQNLNKPSSLTIDPINRTLYWISDDAGRFEIQAVSLDDFNKWTVINDTHLGKPSSLIVDIDNKKLLWIDDGNVGSFDLVEGVFEFKFYIPTVRQIIKYKGYLVLIEESGAVYIADTKSDSVKYVDSVGGKFNAWSIYDISTQPTQRDACDDYRVECDHLCVPSLGGKSQCKCRLGYILNYDQHSCGSYPLQTNFALTVDFTYGLIYQVSLRNAEIVALKSSQSIYPMNAIYDGGGKMIIYADGGFKEIRQLSANDGYITTLTNTDQFEPRALVIDPSTGALLFSAVNTKSYIGILNIKTRQRRTIVPGLSTVFNIAIVPHKGLLFWTDMVLTESYIGRSYMDGSNMKNLIYKDILQPDSLAIDYINEILYWSDGKQGTINSCNFDGEYRRRIIQDNKLNFMHLALSGDYLYYTSLNDQKINKLKISVKQTEPWMSYENEFGKLQSLSIYEDQNIPENLSFGNKHNGIRPIFMSNEIVLYENPTGTCDFGQPKVSKFCAKNNGMCSTFCLATSRGRTCACPDGVKLQEDKRTCSGGTTVSKCTSNIPNGNVNDGCTGYSGAICSYICNNGFIQNSDVISIRCDEGGEWNETMDVLCIQSKPEGQMTQVDEGAIAGGIVAASLAVLLVFVLIIIFLCRRGSSLPSEPNMHFVQETLANGNSIRKNSKVRIEDTSAVNPAI